ncbi:hypothetical protein B0H10DRAFT_1982687 [Mycena sp. CBHHK59/15]|nr:hypothetical protein B0H10DRAFT_1982687 [Mycena sp. CBHHK59/15]
MSNLTILRTYAQTNPSKLPSSVLFSHTSSSLTIYDAFPKGIFHFLVLPRIQAPFSDAELSSLKTLLAGDKARAQQLLTALREDAAALRTEIEAEMLPATASSGAHLHLHVLSNDLCSERMKVKKHYNSFHPTLGFFLDIDEVLSWFDAEPSYYSAMAKLDKKRYEPMLKEDLTCWRCDTSIKNMPTLKAHLQEEWDKEVKREKAKIERQRQLEKKEHADKEVS